MSDHETTINKSTDVHVSKDRQFESLFDSGYSTGTLSSTNIDASTALPPPPTASASASTSTPSTCTPSSSYFKPSDCKATSRSITSTAITTTDSGLCIDSDINLSTVSNATSSHLQTESVCNQTIAWNSLAAFTPDQEGDTLLHLAIVKGHTCWAHKIIQYCPDPNLLDMTNSYHQTPLHLAALSGQSDVVRRLILAGATLDITSKTGNTVLHMACEMGDLECVKCILEPISTSELTETRQAYYKPQIETIDLIGLIHSNNHEGVNCVHLAVKAGNRKLVEYLNSFGANMNLREGKSGWTALHLAVSSAREDLVQLLVNLTHVNVNQSNYAGCTPLKLAARLDNWFRCNANYKSQVTSMCKIMVLLLEAGALMHDGNRLHCVHSDTEDETDDSCSEDDDDDDDEEDEEDDAEKANQCDDANARDEEIVDAVHPQLSSTYP